GRLLPARRPPRRRDEVHAAQDAALLARRDRLLLPPPAPAGDVCRAAQRRRGLRRDPRGHRPAHSRFLPAGIQLAHDRHPAARGDPADRPRGDRGVRRADLRRGQAPAAVHSSRGAQPSHRLRASRRRTDDAGGPARAHPRAHRLTGATAPPPTVRCCEAAMRCNTPHPPLTVLRRSALLAVLVASICGAGSQSAAAGVCAGSDGRPCPYGAVSIIGQRAEGMLRFPEAVAVDTEGNVYVADQLGYVVQKFTAAGAVETEWGAYGGGQGQFGPIGGLATDAGGDVYVVDSSH